MFRKIMVPVDLGHKDELTRALTIAADLGAHYGAQVHMVGVAATTATNIAASPADYAQKLAAFAEDTSIATGTKMIPHTEAHRDPAIGLFSALQGAAEKMSADLIVMASHVPGLSEYVFASNAGYLASHSSLSVMVVR